MVEQTNKVSNASGKITYRFQTPAHPGRILYVNLVSNYACINDCLFCSRPRGREDIGNPNIYEPKAGTSLYLPTLPPLEEIMDHIRSGIRPTDSEVAIVGLGEPLIHLPTIIDTIRGVKAEYEVRTRVDTNGLAKCMHHQPAERLRQAGLDEIRISLNATNEQEYATLCRPRFKNAFQNLIGFIGDCLETGLDTHVSFVVGFDYPGITRMTDTDLIEYAKRIGVKEDKIILRHYIAPEA